MTTPVRLILGIFLFLLIIPLTGFTDPVVVSGGGENDYESWLARLNDGRLMVVFDRNPDWASGDLYVAFSSDNGANWTSPQAIITDAGDQATLCFVQMPSDTIWLWYASNEAGAYGIYEAWSLDGLVWNKTGQIDLGWSSGTTHYDPTVILEDDGSLTMSYVVSGSGVYIAHKPDKGVWDTDRTRISSSGFRARVMKHSNGTYLYAYHKRTGGTYDYDVFVTTSTDRINWSTHIQLTTNMNSHDPFAGEMQTGAYRVYYAKYTGTAYNLYYRESTDAVSWDPERAVTTDAVNNTQPHFFDAPDGHYLVWAYAVDYPDDHDVYFLREGYITDTDGDGFPNGEDNCPLVFNPLQEDVDLDGLGDSCDLCPTDSLNDADEDGVCYSDDNCPDEYNPDQDDADCDYAGDECDICPGIIDHAYYGQTCTCCIGIRGNADNDPEDKVNIVDLTYFIAYLFTGGPPPPCAYEANIDGDCKENLNIVDLTRLVAYLFTGGDAPPACDECVGDPCG